MQAEGSGHRLARTCVGCALKHTPWPPMLVMTTQRMRLRCSMLDMVDFTGKQLSAAWDSGQFVVELVGVLAEARM